MKKNSIFIIFAAAILIISAVFVVLSTRPQKSGKSNKLAVTTSFYPLAYLAQRIGGARTHITNLTPPGIEPHDFEPSTRNIAELSNQDIIIINGGGLEGYANKIKENIDPKQTLFAAAGQPLMSDSSDPHVWLDPLLYVKEADAVRDIFTKRDPSHAGEYSANYDRLKTDLLSLDGELRSALGNCSQRTIITSHKAFGYLAKRYGLNQVALAGLSPDAEPSPKTLMEVTDFAKKNHISYIFFEELVSPRIAQTLAHEVGAKTLVFNPLEGLTDKELKEGKTYISVQKDNLKSLQIALACK